MECDANGMYPGLAAWSYREGQRERDRGMDREFVTGGHNEMKSSIFKCLQAIVT